MSDEEVEDKFRQLAASRMSGARMDEVLAKLWRLDEMEKAGDAVALLAGLQ